MAQSTTIFDEDALIEGTSGCIRWKRKVVRCKPYPYSIITTSSSSSHVSQFTSRQGIAPEELQQQTPNAQPTRQACCAKGHVQDAQQWMLMQVPPSGLVQQQQVLLSPGYVMHEGVALPLDACVNAAIQMCTKSVHGAVAAVHTAYTVCATCPDAIVAQQALNDADKLMNETIRRVQLALKLSKLQRMQQLAAVAMASAAAAAAGKAPAVDPQLLDSSYLDSACSSLVGPRQQQLVLHQKQGGARFAGTEVTAVAVAQPGMKGTSAVAKHQASEVLFDAQHKQQQLALQQAPCIGPPQQQRQQLQMEYACTTQHALEHEEVASSWE